MSYESIKDMIFDEYRITFDVYGKDAQIKLVGIIDTEDSCQVIDPFFSNVHNAALNSGIKSIKINLTELYFINSGLIKCLIKWLVKLPKLTEKEKYKVIFLINKDLSWQMQSFDLFKYFGKGLVEIQS